MLADFPAFLNSIPWYAWIPIVAIVCGAIVKLFAMQHRHNERLAMIRQGMKPDPISADDD